MGERIESSPTAAQVTLSREQLDEFDFGGFVESQISALRGLLETANIRFDESDSIVDVGGGRGYFAEQARQVHGRVSVLETDEAAVRQCLSRGIDARLGNAVSPEPSGSEKLVCLNLILHHLVGSSEDATVRLQAAALSAWHKPYVFVHEYCYQGFGGTDIPGRLIFWVTSSRLLSGIARVVGRIVPSLRANTLGVGVRFRSSNAWRRMFENKGFAVIGVVEGVPEVISPPRRLLCIQSIRRDSFLIKRREPG